MFVSRFRLLLVVELYCCTFVKPTPQVFVGSTGEQSPIPLRSRSQSVYANGPMPVQLQDETVVVDELKLRGAASVSIPSVLVAAKSGLCPIA